MKCDIKDYFMSGDQNELASVLASAWPHPESRDEFRRLSEFILTSQMIHEEGEDYLVVEGTGMGLSHSGEVSDWCFLNTVELATLCNGGSLGNGVSSTNYRVT